MSGFTSAVGAELSFQIGHGFGHDWGTLGQAVAHGISQGVITQIRGGKFNGGFISAFISKLTGGALQKLGIDGDDAGEIVLGTAATAIMGGLASEASGGSFYDGAVSAAVVYLYNDLKTKRDRQKYIFKKARELLKDAKIYPGKYGDKIIELLKREGGIRYVDSPKGEVIGGNGKKAKKQLTFGYARHKKLHQGPERITLTSYNWAYWEKRLSGFQLKATINNQVKHVILHEIKHLFVNTGLHLPNDYAFDEDIRKMGY